jgi:hypothetical protein
VDPRSGLDTVVRIKAHSPLLGLVPPIVQPIVQRYNTELSQFLRVKVKLFICLTKHHAMKAYWGSEGIVSHIL